MKVYQPCRCADTAKKIKAAIIILPLLVHAASCSRKGQTEKEPNNTFSTATPITEESRILGFMDTPGDRDFYSLSIGKKRIADIQLSGVKGINLALRIWKGESEPKTVKWIDDNRKSSPERIPNMCFTPGTYYLEVFQSDRDPKRADRENGYELSIKTRDAVSEESEPNDSKGNADTLHPDREMTGYFAPAYNRLNDDQANLHREEDWFAVDVSLKADVPAMMTVNLSGVAGVNSILFLYDADENEIARSDKGGTGEPESLSGVGIQKSGTYYVMVASKGYMANYDEPYTVSVSLKEHDSGAEMESNDDFGTANTIVNNVITGKINSRDDRDFFLYKVNEPSLYRIELRPPEDMDGLFSLYGKDREKIIDINNAGKGKKEVYPDFYADRDFYVAVSARAAGALSTGDYILSVTPLAGADNFEREPNNELTRANILKNGKISGFTSYKADKDYFLLTYTRQIKERFEVRGVKNGEIRVSITDPMGYIIKSVDIRGDRVTEFTEMVDKMGYIIVEPVVENYDNPYTITLRGNK